MGNRFMPQYGHIVYAGRLWSIRRIPHAAESRWWFHFWTPLWHAGRGPYVSIGVGVVSVSRGY